MVLEVILMFLGMVLVVLEVTGPPVTGTLNCVADLKDPEEELLLKHPEEELQIVFWLLIG